MKITFLGATQEVTGSKYLIEHENLKILVDCGLFQGHEQSMNNNPLPVAPSNIDAIILTHAHIDHTGYIPIIVKQGFNGKIYCTQGTYDLAAIMLVDSGRVQEDNAKKMENAGVPPLYTELDAQRSLKFFQIVAYDKPIDLGTSLNFTLIFSGHILGSSFVVISDGKQKITFSGDLGGSHQLVIQPPEHLHQTDYLVIESTYGDRLHDHTDPMKALTDVIHETIKKDGVLIIPSFAVMRAQTILYCLYQLKQKNLIPNIPIFLDSPMALKVSNLFCEFSEQLNISREECVKMLDVAQYIHSTAESKAIDDSNSAMIIVAGSGMAEGGRVLHHFKRFISDPKNTVAFVGYQVEDTMGYILTHGTKEIKIEDKYYTIQAEIKNIDLFSAHADYNEILEWLGHFKTAPKKVFVTHGTLQAALNLQNKIEQRFGWSVKVPQYLEFFELD